MLTSLPPTRPPAASTEESQGTEYTEVYQEYTNRSSHLSRFLAHAHTVCTRLSFPPTQLIKTGKERLGTRLALADEESRVMKDRSDWMLCPRVFNKINQVMGPLQVDLFASRLTHQLRDFVSWRPDPEAMATDAFTLDWKQFRGYANPPWSLVGRVLSQVREQKAQLVLVAPVWKSQIWYPTLLGMVIQEPLLLPASPELIQPTHRVNKPDISPTLAAWPGLSQAKIPNTESF